MGHLEEGCGEAEVNEVHLILHWTWHWIPMKGGRIGKKDRGEDTVIKALLYNIHVFMLN